MSTPSAHRLHGGARAAKQLRGWARGSARGGGACLLCGRAGQGLATSSRTVASPIHLFWFLQNSPKI